MPTSQAERETQEFLGSGDSTLVSRGPPAGVRHGRQGCQRLSCKQMQVVAQRPPCSEPHVATRKDGGNIAGSNARGKKIPAPPAQLQRPDPSPSAWWLCRTKSRLGHARAVIFSLLSVSREQRLSGGWGRGCRREGPCRACGAACRSSFSPPTWPAAAGQSHSPMRAPRARCRSWPSDPGLEQHGAVRGCCSCWGFLASDASDKGWSSSRRFIMGASPRLLPRLAAGGSCPCRRLLLPHQAPRRLPQQTQQPCSRSSGRRPSMSARAGRG